MLRFALAASCVAGLLCVCSEPAAAAEFDVVRNVEAQPLIAATERLLQALDVVGAPLPEEDVAALREAMQQEDAKETVVVIQEILDRHCLAQVTINPESRVKAQEGPVAKQLVQQGWSTFLVKVHNEAQFPHAWESPQAAGDQLGRQCGSGRRRIRTWSRRPKRRSGSWMLISSTSSRSSRNSPD